MRKEGTVWLEEVGTRVAQSKSRWNGLEVAVPTRKYTWVER